ncbi:MAG: hypothetical protein MJZ77_06295 [Bacteroidales bacterium]|nr:hypothetical protein [Bacteroidales bacterium]
MKSILGIMLCLMPVLLFAQEGITQGDNTYAIRNEAGQVITSHHPIFDSHSHKVVEIIYSYDESGVVCERTLCSFDKQCREIRRETYTADAYPLFVQETKYDAQGRKIKLTQTTYNEDGTRQTYNIVYKYKGDACRTFLNGKEITL